MVFQFEVKLFDKECENVLIRMLVSQFFIYAADNFDDILTIESLFLVIALGIFLARATD